MLPDLDSPPGPWWTANLAGEASAGGWYTEFGDRRREVEVPAIVQLFHMQRSFEYLKADFDQRPLELRPGGGEWSKSYSNQTGLVAAKAGFGIFQAEPDFYYYLDRDLVLDMMGISPHLTIAYDRPLHPELWPPHPDGPMMVVFHDRDISFEPQFIERLLAALPAAFETVSTNQYVGFLHAGIESAASAASNEWGIKFVYDEPYCAYFSAHPSSWRLWLSDTMREKLRPLQSLVTTVDGKIVSGANVSDSTDESLTIDIPPGIGEHVWRLSRAR
jgi:hypothetical protein